MSLPFYQLNTHMDINELESFKLSDAVKFHNELNPKIFSHYKMDPEVREQLMLIAKDFITYLGIGLPKIEDITISGSNAAYSYTDKSDLDLHILVDMTQLSDDEVYRELFDAKKKLYNDEHEITVRGIPVELYVQDSNQKHFSLGEYSVLKNDWIKMPTKRRANFDQIATRLKYEKLSDLVDTALQTQDQDRLDKVLDIIKRYRQAGLSHGGEFSPENLAYKAARSQGAIKALYDLKNELHSEKLSIESEIKNVNEVSGYIPSKKQANDPRFKTALTVDVKPDSIKKNAKAFGWNISRAGKPPLLRK